MGGSRNVPQGSLGSTAVTMCFLPIVDLSLLVLLSAAQRADLAAAEALKGLQAATMEGVGAA